MKNLTETIGKLYDSARSNYLALALTGSAALAAGCATNANMIGSTEVQGTVTGKFQYTASEMGKYTWDSKKISAFNLKTKDGKEIIVALEPHDSGFEGQLYNSISENDFLAFDGLRLQGERNGLPLYMASGIEAPVKPEAKPTAVPIATPENKEEPQAKSDNQ